MENFIIGCNYWASNAGTDMWRNFDTDVIKEDLEILSSHGIRYMRVFPNWRDFQPVIAIYSAWSFHSFMMENDKQPQNKYYLDEEMLNRFEIFCNLCKEYNIKLIVGLMTGGMSGRRFLPPAFTDKNPITDLTVILFEQRFVKGFIERLKYHPAIYAWDLGNECNYMGNVNSEAEATNWSLIISNAIKAADPTRPIISGMHGLSVESNNGEWTIQGQAEANDILTTHPYPFWVNPADKDKISSFRTLMHATAQTKLYADIAKKPCLVEETGTMGPMICSNERAADFMHLNLFSNYANGSLGVMWWCANEQTNLTAPPYSYQMCEVELGMIDKFRKPKPVLLETQKTENIISSFDFELPKAHTDAVCLLTKGINQWDVSYMTYCLAKQAGLNISFAYCNDEIPDADTYILPSLNGHVIMDRQRYLDLILKVKDNGSVLYVSNNGGIISEFEENFGMKVEDSEKKTETGSFIFDGEKFNFMRERIFELTPTNADVLAYDNTGNPIISKNKLGNGFIYYLNFPLESMLVEQSNAFEGNYCDIYRKIFADKISSHEVISNDKNVCVTLHYADDKIYCTAINYSDKTVENPLSFKDGYSVKENIYGDINQINAFDAVIFTLSK